MAKRATYGVNKDGWWVLRTILENLEEFNPDSATLRGRKMIEPFTNYSTGQLPDSERAKMRDSIVSYVVYSYRTPIAYRRVADWNRNGTANYEWIVPDVRYSVTTSKHQGRVRPAIAQIGK